MASEVRWRRGGTECYGSEALALVQGVLHAFRKRLVADAQSKVMLMNDWSGRRTKVLTSAIWMVILGRSRTRHTEGLFGLLKPCARRLLGCRGRESSHKIGNSWIRQAKSVNDATMKNRSAHRGTNSTTRKPRIRVSWDGLQPTGLRTIALQMVAKAIHGMQSPHNR